MNSITIATEINNHKVTVGHIVEGLTEVEIELLRSELIGYIKGRVTHITNSKNALANKETGERTT